MPKYSELVTGEVAGLRVGVLKEGLEGCVCVWRVWWTDRVVVISGSAIRVIHTPNMDTHIHVSFRCEDDVCAATLAAAKRLKEAGAEVEEVSVPLHRDSAWVGWTMFDWLVLL